MGPNLQKRDDETMNEPRGGWKKLFQEWPKDLGRNAILITLYGEQVNFADFMIGEEFLLLSRSAPDSVGARTIIVPYDQIASLKITTVVKNKVFEEAGFQVATSAKSRPAKEA